jgi:hypothetical protein
MEYWNILNMALSAVTLIDKSGKGKLFVAAAI